jgi:hypothetical protein
MSDACDNIPHHGQPVSSVVFFDLPTSSLDTPQKSCDNEEQAIEDTPDDPTLTTHHSGFRCARVCLVNSIWTRGRGQPPRGETQPWLTPFAPASSARP